MGQSLNLFNKNTSLKYLNDLYLHARNRGLKSTYYLRNKSASQIEKATAPSSDRHNTHASNNNDSEPAPEACNMLDSSCESCQ